MKRQLRFKGKRVDNGEWLHGDLIENQGRYFIYHATSENTIQDNDDGNITIVATEVHADSIGLHPGNKYCNEKIIMNSNGPAMKKGYEAYRSNNPDYSEFMETDYKAGFSDGYKAAYDEIREIFKSQKREPYALEYSPIQTTDASTQFIPFPRLTVATAVIQGLLSSHLWMSNEAKAVLKITRGNEKEGSDLLKKTIVSDALELTDELLAQISQGKK